jgi:acetyltransferase-like isoleucine patch superfamily enzyme
MSGVAIEIGEMSCVFGNISVVRPGARVKIGKRCQIGKSNLICAKSIEIGDDVLMAWGVTVMDNDSHSLAWQQRSHDVLQGHADLIQFGNVIQNKDWDNVQCGDINIGAKSWIGLGVTILKGVTIGEKSVIGAGSVVTSDIPPNSIAGGNPARVIRKIEENFSEKSSD